jgi:hypothetical protein
MVKVLGNDFFTDTTFSGDDDVQSRVCDVFDQFPDSFDAFADSD